MLDMQAGEQPPAPKTLVTDAFRAGDSVTTGTWIGLGFWARLCWLVFRAQPNGHGSER